MFPTACLQVALLKGPRIFILSLECLYNFFNCEAVVELEFAVFQ